VCFSGNMNLVDFLKSNKLITYEYEDNVFCPYCGGRTHAEWHSEGVYRMQISTYVCEDCFSYAFFEYDEDTDYALLSNEEWEEQWVKGPKYSPELLRIKDEKERKMILRRKYQYSRLENVE